MWFKPKYNSRTCEYKGEKYHSKKEAEVARELDLRMFLNKQDPLYIHSWERQIKFPIVVNEKKVCNYIVDFAIIDKDGNKEYIEVKGYMTPVASLKIKLFRALYPDHKLTIIK